MDPAGPVENAPRFPPPLGRRSRAAHRLHRPYDRSPRKGTGYNPRSTQARRYRQESEERRSAPMRRSECPEQAFRLAGMRIKQAAAIPGWNGGSPRQYDGVAI